MTLTSPPPGASYQWKKDGTDIPGATNLSLTASVTGAYTVVVTIGGNSTTYGPTNVKASTQPAASFTSSPNGQCSNTPVSFTNTSTGTGLTYFWNFGDGNSGSNNASTATHPTHTFIGTPGNNTQDFTVTLTANNAGCTNTTTATITTKRIPGVQLGGSGSVTYNGLQYFTSCASTTSNFSFSNQSSTKSTNTGYIIKWGDGSPDFSSPDFSTLATHSYGVGNYHLQFIVTGNGCIDTGDYYVFVGNNPAVGLNNPGNTFICSQTSLTFPISGTTNNPPGTVYTVSFNDGSTPISFNHPAPADVTHKFDKGSCGTTSGSFPNSFQATIQASNPCGVSAASVVPIYVSEKTKAVIGYTPDTIICVNTTLTVNNISGSGFGVTSTGVCTPGKGIWTISPATGWTIQSGSRGDDFGTTDPSLWQNGTDALSIRFTSPGTYTIKLKTGATATCGGAEVTQTICVNPAPTASFVLSTREGCAPLTVATTNNSNTPLCLDNTYEWSVIYSNTSGCSPAVAGVNYLNGTSSSSKEPQFQFSNAGVYTISLVTKNSKGLCTSAPFSQTVTVKDKPQATITAPNAVCQNGSITPTATVQNCYASSAATYSWSFPGGNPSSSTSAIPGTITYNTSGVYAITLAVTNECGTTTIAKSITVNPAPDVQAPANLSLCAGTSTGVLAFTGSVPSATYKWTNSNTAIGLPASGVGNIASFVATNTSNSPISATINVTPTSGCSGPSQSFTITVNPRPVKPGVVSPIVYCLNETAAPLSASAGTGNTLTWYTSLPSTGGSATAPIPSTTTAGVTTYYVTQKNSCESEAASITVTVNPAIAGNIIASDQTLCNGSAAQPLITQGTISGGAGSYSYLWQESTDGGASWTTIAGTSSQSYNPGAVTSERKYRRIVSSSTCRDTSNVVTIVVQGSLTNVGIGSAQTICSGTQPALLQGQLPTGGNGAFTYQWESSPDGTAWSPITGANGQDYQPGALTSSTYYKRKVSSGQCAVYSSTILVTVNPKPVMNTMADQRFCNDATTGVLNFGATPTASTYAWLNDNPAIGLAASGNGNLPSFTAINSSKVPVMATIKVAPTYTNNGVSCFGDTATFRIIVLPTITLASINNEEKCTGQTIGAYVPVPDTASYPGISINYSWTVSGGGITLTSGSGAQIPAYTTFNPGTTDLVATVTVTPQYSYGGKTCAGTPTSYTVTVKPATANANAGADQVLCAVTSASLNANFVNGTSGVWSQIAGSATITSPNQNITTVTGLVPGQQYQFVWTQTGYASCPATTDTVVIDNKLPLENKIDTTSQTICAGVSLNIAGQPATGGGNSYTYRWEQSTDGINFSPIAGSNSQNITIIPISTVWLRRFVNAPPCSGYSDTMQINVQPALANNSISANAIICTGLIPNPINGTLPTGGNNNFSYVWEQSTNGGASWTTIPGATGLNYAPSVLTQTTQYRRIVSTDQCNGPFGSTSNVVTITVNPDAEALFLPTDTVKCPPFVITPVIINLQTNTANSQYHWFADGVLIGTGVNFPGYTLASENDSVLIKLVAISLYGCKNDSLEQEFKTVKKPTPSFTLSDTVGCGPLTVQVTNTSTYIDEFTYFWDFGNGQTSTSMQPGVITFAPNPTYDDTTYLVTLQVFSPCDTLSFSKSVRVKSRPKALFTPTKTTGCSPLTVVFKNTSKGLNNTYFWDFGDGTTHATAAPDSVEHTFVTGVVDTFYVKLIATNECGGDTLTYSIIVAPNTIKLNLAVNGTERFGCEPHAVSFVNNSQGASVFHWNFGDGAITTTTKNLDTVRHIYLSPGTYLVTLRAINNCSDTSTTETIVVYPKPRASFTAEKYTLCIGDTLRVTNLSDSATAYLWKFGDGTTSTLSQPTHIYNTPGSYTVTLITYRDNASGNVCIDSTEHTIQVTPTQMGLFTISNPVGACAPYAVTLVNKNTPAVTAQWDLGDGIIVTGDSIVHTYPVAGTYYVTLTATVPGGCTYITTDTIEVLGPKGVLQYTGGNVCHPSAVQFKAVATGAATYFWDFGDGTTRTTTTQTVFHSYAEPGAYLPKVTLQNGGCEVVLKGIDTIKVDRVDGGFTFAKTEVCGNTTLHFADTSHVFTGVQSIQWDFGDNTTGSGAAPSHNYAATGRYTVQMIVVSNSGCTDTVTRQIDVLVKSVPVVSINATDTACTRRDIRFSALIQTVDAVNLIQWNLSNGASGAGAVFNHTFTQPGTYDLRLVAGTVNGCYDTAFHTITINPSPVVTATPSLDLCRGNTVQLNAFGAASWQWMPLQGLSCYTCPDPIASPTVTTPYVIEGRNSFGCPDWDTVVITVIQPLQLNVSPDDSICIGQSSNLLVSGGTSYNWSPAAGLSSTTISNPIASPTTTTTYRVVGYDGYNCFTDTAFVTVAVGQYPTVDLGPDLILATGTMHPLTSSITNGPIRNWVWNPTTNLSCAGCSLPIAEIKKDISYTVQVTTPYGCSATDTVSIKVFCKDGQVFIPNAFTPDGDGVNDRLMVRASGIVSVTYFRIFNRWGDLVFERSNFRPNDLTSGWDGRVRGVVSGPEVFVYTCEVLCENGTSYTYKGNVSIIK